MRLLFAYECTFADSGRGCNGIVKLLKRLIVARRIVYQSQHPRTFVHTPMHASWLNEIEIYFSAVSGKCLRPTTFPISRHSQVEERLSPLS